jgi:hypothetical protein
MRKASASTRIRRKIKSGTDFFKFSLNRKLTPPGFGAG